MKQIIVFVLWLITLSASTAMSLDMRDEAPKGKKWVKVTDSHYMDKTSVKKIKGGLYQAKICNYASNSKIGFWVYSDVRVACGSKQAWSNSGGKWYGPMPPVNYELGVINVVCK